MKVSELSDRSGVTIASIKFSLREELIFAGTAKSATRTNYDEVFGVLGLIVTLVVPVRGGLVTDRRRHPVH